MSEQARTSGRAIRGTIRRRLLVNAVVDPDEAATRLPEGMRPHVTALGTVVGCCLLEIEGIRPARLPAVVGTTLRAAAHRISAEWEDGSDEAVVGVYVPVRHTDSRLAIVAGGRWFPGVHQRAQIDIAENAGTLRWETSPGDARGFGIRVTATIPSAHEASLACEPVGGTCLGANVGLSPDHHGVLEGARMEPDHRVARQVMIDEIDSAFLSSFSTTQAAPSYLLTDVGVTWTPAASPQAPDRVVRT
jgi:hypothetical protein